MSAGRQTCRRMVERSAAAVSAAATRLSAKTLGPHAIHLARRHLKQARAALSLARGCVPKPSRRRLDQRLRAIGGLLGTARDVHVLRRALDAFVASGRVEGVRCRRWLDRLHRDEKTLIARLSLERVHRRLRRAERGLRKLAADLPSGGSRSVDAALARCYRRAGREYHRVHARFDSVSLHRLRQRAQRLCHGYAALGRGASDAPPWYRPAVRLVDLLGRERDLVLLDEALDPRWLTRTDRDRLHALITAVRARLRQRALRQADQAFVHPRRGRPSRR